MKKTKSKALCAFAALLGAFFVIACVAGFAACGGGSDDDCADGHTVTTWTWVDGKEADCGNDGTRTGVCDVCGETVTETVKATGNHTWNSGEITTPATETTDGEMTYTCTVCGATKSDIIKATGTQGDDGDDGDDDDEETGASFSVELQSSLSVVQGLTAELTVTVTADDASEAEIVWTSSNTSVASVTEDSSDSTKATVAANAAGSATITVTVTIDEEEVSADCAVTVTAPVATAIALDVTSMSVAEGDVNTLTASVTMNNSGSYSGSYSWSSSDTSVATVEGSGSTATVTALKAGAASISVSVDGVEAANCAVTVSSRLAVPDVTNNELDKAALSLGNDEYFAGSDYTIEKSTTTNEEEVEETVYEITGTASAMTDTVATWFGDGAKKNDSYIVLKIFVGIGNTVSYSSHATVEGEVQKSYTNTDGTGVFDGDYLFMVERLTGVYADGTQVTNLDGVSYTIADASGNERETVDIEFNMETTPWDGTSYSTAWYDKAESGTTEFTIYSAEELAGLANIVNTKEDSGNDQSEMSFVNQKVKLGANINLANKNWTPIGHQKDDAITGATVTEYFDGDFDGNGFTIYNLDVEPETGAEHEQIGLFGHVFGGTFENIHITNAKVVGTKNVGALVGAASVGNGSGGTYGTDCTVSGCTVDGLVDIEGNYQVGGLFGSVTKVKLENCSVNGDEGSKVMAWDEDAENTSEYSAGGIVGCAVGDSIDTSQIVTTGNWTWSGLSVSGLEISAPARVGGIAGKYYDECGRLAMKDCTVSDCELSIVQDSGTSKTPTIGAFIGVYVAQINILDGNSVTNVQINYTDEQYIGSSNDGTYLLFGGSEPQTSYQNDAFVSFGSDGNTYTIYTDKLTCAKLTSTNTENDGDGNNS